MNLGPSSDKMFTGVPRWIHKRNFQRDLSDRAIIRCTTLQPLYSFSKVRNDVNRVSSLILVGSNGCQVNAKDLGLEVIGTLCGLVKVSGHRK